MLVKDIENSRWTFWFQWVLAHTVGFATATTLIALLGWYETSTAVYGWALTGTLVGIGQWFVLQQRLPHIAFWNWFKASFFGFGIGVVVGLLLTIRLIVGGNLVDVLGPVGLAIVPGITGGAGAGAGAGLLQWRILRKQLKKAGWWVVISTIAWIVAMSVSRASNLILDLTVANPGGLVIIGAISGAIVGIITGFSMWWLLQQPVGEP